MILYAYFDTLIYLEDTKKEELYEVIDECVEMETPEVTKDTQAEVATCPQSDNTTQQDSKTDDAGKM